MDPTLEIAALSMQADAQRLGTLSQNLANAATPGYKRLIDVRSAFAGLLDGPAAQPAGAVVTDFSAGSLRHTGQALDLVADGGAFLELRSERQGLRYVRSGSFRVDADGRVVNAAGDVLQLAGGDLVLRGAQRELQVDARGAVHAGG